MGGTDRSPPTTSPLAAAALDHVLLSYAYLDDGDLDGYGSLLADDARLIRPGQPNIIGRDQILAELARTAGPPRRHRLYRVIAHDDHIIARGRCTHEDVDFVDVVTFSADGLLCGQRRYYATAEA
ncbi:MAG TPA: nuclear transport factor 2 family protein [Pseudonocardiaceae bacterium]